ncbi:MAG: D-alanine--D-alanine ligase [Desulfobacterales bacterium]|nr:D-alanine--D-alanine ligase [Desulfobacterales bacterium]
MERKTNIAILAGGWSGEREVSLGSGQAVYDALDKERFDVSMYDPGKDLKKLINDKKQIDLAFVLMHGKYGEDGCIQGLLEILKIPTVGSGVLSSAMAMKKDVAKGIFRRCGLNVAKDIVIRRGHEPLAPEGIIEALGPDTVVKPVCEGSSLGISICHTKDELIEGIDNAFKHGHEVIIEEYIDGREITCCVLGTQTLSTLPLIEIKPGEKYRFFDYEAKYTKGATNEICPAEISETLAQRLASCAKTAHQALGCRVWSRTDMIIRDEDIYLLETNTIPGMTENSLFPLAARASGLSLSGLVDKLVLMSLAG